jgi:Cation transporter/ATPase, N-terminus
VSGFDRFLNEGGPYRKRADEVLAALGSDAQAGLSHDEARRRLERYGRPRGEGVITGRMWIGIALQRVQRALRRAQRVRRALHEPLAVGLDRSFGCAPGRGDLRALPAAGVLDRAAQRC